MCIPPVVSQYLSWYVLAALTDSEWVVVTIEDVETEMRWGSDC